jgi:DNA invertase Pin-like site-specific DNA recombinase
VNSLGTRIVRPGRKELDMTSTHGKLLAALLAVSVSATAFAAEVDRRQANQQARIAEGVENGQLTPRETARLERKEARIRREIRRDRAANGGKLTPAEKAKINREENRTSRRIYRAKHNDKHM